MDGQVYERAAIEEWFQRCRVSLVTGRELPSLELTPVEPLRQAIEEYMNSRPELTRKELDQEALQCAAAALERELVEKHRRIINQGAVGSASSRMLLEASKHGHGYVIEYLAEIGVPLDAPLDANDWNRRTAAHYSAKNG